MFSANAHSPSPLMHHHLPPFFGICCEKQLVMLIILLTLIFLFSFFSLFLKYSVPFSYFWASHPLFLRGAHSALGSPYSLDSITGLWDLESVISVPDMMALLFQIPTSAVEMPGSADVTGLNVQFGALEFGSEPSLSEFGSTASSENSNKIPISLYSKSLRYTLLWIKSFVGKVK